MLGDRLVDGRRYLELLDDPPWSSWSDGYEQYRAGRLELPASILLAHPSWLADLSRRDRVYGRRTFERLTDPGQYSCRAEAIWGYKCAMRHQPIQFDHRFPYAFGGPTEAQNRLALCAVHNASKSSDVHLYAWDKPEPIWLEPLLRRLEPWT